MNVQPAGSAVVPDGIAHFPRAAKNKSCRAPVRLDNNWRSRMGDMAGIRNNPPTLQNIQYRYNASSYMYPIRPLISFGDIAWS